MIALLLLLALPQSDDVVMGPAAAEWNAWLHCGWDFVDHASVQNDRAETLADAALVRCISDQVQYLVAWRAEQTDPSDDIVNAEIVRGRADLRSYLVTRAIARRAGLPE